jgi:hypothetical protein
MHGSGASRREIADTHPRLARNPSSLRNGFAVIAGGASAASLEGGAAARATSFETALREVRQILIVRSAASPRVSNHEAVRRSIMIRPNLKMF